MNGRVKDILGGKKAAPHGIGTKLAEYSDDGPFHCENCKYLKGAADGDIFADDDGKGRCNQKFMKKDPDVDHDKAGLAIVDIENGCCRFVEPIEDAEAD